MVKGKQIFIVCLKMLVKVMFNPRTNLYYELWRAEPDLFSFMLFFGRLIDAEAQPIVMHNRFGKVNEKQRSILAKVCFFQ